MLKQKVPEDVTYTTNPWFVQLPSTDSEGDDWFYDVVCYPKNETGVPTLDKRVRNNPDKDNVTTANQDALADFTQRKRRVHISEYSHSIQGRKNWIISFISKTATYHIKHNISFYFIHSMIRWLKV